MLKINKTNWKKRIYFKQCIVIDCNKNSVLLYVLEKNAPDYYNVYII